MDGENFGASISVPAPERRLQARYSVDEDSVLLIMSHGVPVSGRIENLSLSGCRVRTRERISARVGSRIEISFKVNGTAFRFSSVLVWTIGRNFAGIHFVDMIARRKAELGVIIDEITNTTPLAIWPSKVASLRLFTAGASITRNSNDSLSFSSRCFS